ncbi:hypothetical protein GGC47_004460 [Bosea sp. OAE752]
MPHSCMHWAVEAIGSRASKMHKRTILWGLLCAMPCLTAGAILSADYAMVAKKKKGIQGLAGWCWGLAEGAMLRELCFGPESRLRLTVGNRFEGFETTGLYRTGRNGPLELLGFPNEGWPSPSPLLECQIELPLVDILQLGGCELSGRWDRKRKHTD